MAVSVILRRVISLETIKKLTRIYGDIAGGGGFLGMMPTGGLMAERGRGGEGDE